MFDLFNAWYRRKFSDPDASALLLIVVASFALLILWGDMMAPVLIAIVLAYLLEWPVARLERLGASRTFSTIVVILLFATLLVMVLVGLVPVIWRQSFNLVSELPDIWSQTQQWLMSLPAQYPGFVEPADIEKALSGVNDRVVGAGEQLISASLTSIVNLVALLVYLLLVPLMVMFMLKDKRVLMANVSRIVPKDRRLMNKVGREMNIQIVNYIRGKVIEIIIVGTISAVTFTIMDLRYGLLLGVLVGFSVLIPYIGAAVVTVPVAAVALFQWGPTAEFGYLMLAYGIIQGLDGNVLVPLLFSEAVSLHPVYIILAVLFFGGLWGFWGVFFAIPLATLVKAVFSAWAESDVPEDVAPRAE